MNTSKRVLQYRKDHLPDLSAINNNVFLRPQQNGLDSKCAYLISQSIHDSTSEDADSRLSVQTTVSKVKKEISFIGFGLP